MCRVENVLKRRKRLFARHARTYFSCVAVSNTYITNNIEYCITGTPHNHRTIADTTVRITVIGTSHFYCPSSVHLTIDDTLKLHTHTHRYANYYADYYAQAVRNVDKMKYSQDMNQLENANAPPKDVTGGLVGSTKGAVGPIIS